MRKTGLGICLSLLLAAAGAAAADLQIIDITDDFVRTFEAAQGLSEAERVAAFRREIEPLHPAFYGIARFEGRRTQEARDHQITAAFERFPSLRDAYIAKARLVRDNIGKDVATFRTAFPDFAPAKPIYLLHSLGEMDGGTRTLDGGPQLILGADVMATAHSGWRTESAFFHHELFHLYHHPKFGDCTAVWCMLWIEGVAVHVAATLNPGMSDAELLLDFPPGTAAAVRASVPAAAAHMRGVLDSSDDDVMRALFSTAADATGLRPRRGYVIGYLVAQEIARNRALKDLANLPRAEVRRGVENALLALSRK